MTDKKIFIVVDDPIVKQSLEDALHDRGFSVAGAATQGNDAIAKIGETRPDLVLVDIPPYHDGELIKSAENISKQFDIPVIFISADPDETEHAQAVSMPLQACVMKPIRTPELISMIEISLHVHDMEKRLHESENRYRILAESLPDNIYIIGRDDTVQFVNTQAAENLHLPAGEIIGKPRKTFFPPDIADRNMMNLQKVFETGETVHCENIVPYGNKEFWQDTFLIPLKDETKNVTAVLGISRDITGLKQAEEKIRETETRFSDLFESTLDMIQIIRPDGSFVHVNPAWKKSLGYNDEDISTLSVLDIIHPDAMAHCTAIFHDVISGNEARMIETQFLTKDKKTLFVEGNCSPELKGGSVVALRGIFHDVTERKQADVAIVESEKNFRTVLENVPDMVLVHRNGIILYTNPLATEVMGYTHEELINKQMMDFIVPEYHPDVARAMSERMDGKTIEPYEIEILTKSGERKAITVRGSRINFAGSPASINVLTDITERRQADAELRKIAESLEKRQLECRNLVQLNTEAMLVLDTDYSIVFANPAAEHIFGRSSEALNGVPFGFPVTSGELTEIEIPRLDGTVVLAEVRLSEISWEEKPAHMVIIRDISEHRRMEQEIRESEAKYRLLTDNSPSMIYLIDPEGYVRFVNQAAAAQFGLSQEELTGKHLREIYPIPLADQHLRAIRSILDKGINQSFEIQDTYPTGERWIEARMTPVKTEAGNNIGVLGISNDISERKQMEREIKESEKSFRGLFNTVGEAIYVMNVDGNFLEVNKGAMDIYGQPKDFFLDHTIEVLYAPGTFDIGQIIGRLERAFNGEPQKFEFSGCRCNGEVFPAECRLYYGSYFGRDVIIGLMSDITERRKAEAALRESELFNRELVENLPDYVLVYGTDGKILYVNPASVMALGYAAEDLVNTNILAYFAEEHREKAAAKMAARLKGDDPPAYETDIVTREGLRRSVIINGSPIQYHGSPAILMILFDITERKMAEDQIRLMNASLEDRVKDRTRELETATDQLRTSLAAKEVMLREVHHRVKNNLQIIISLLNQQSRQFPDPKTVRAIGESQNRIRAISMVHERLFVTRDIENIDLGGYLYALAANLFQYYKVSRERVKVSVAIENITVTIDTAVPLGLIINELVANSLRHAFPGETAGEISITGNEAGGMLEIRVADTGIGMPPGAGSEDSETFGIQLIKMLVDQLDGTVEFLPPPGTAVVLRIPKKEG